MKTLRTVVVGLGRIGWQFHMPQVQAHPGFALVAAVDPLLERQVEARETYGINTYPSLAALLEDTVPDLVVIASPTEFHMSQALTAFKRGCDVFCDKPLAVNLAEAEAMVTAMQQHGRKLMVYQPHRASVETVALREILAQGLIGPVYMMKRARSAYLRRNDWQAFRTHGGGMLNNYGAHYIDLLLYLSGAYSANGSIRRITCTLRTIASLGDADDVVKAVIETAEGMILDVDINMAAAQRLRPWQILGAYGSIMLDEEAAAWYVRYYDPQALGEGVVHRELAAPQRRYGNIDETIPWQEARFPLADFTPVDFYEQCYAYYARDEEAFVPVAQTYELMRVLASCRRDASRGAAGKMK